MRKASDILEELIAAYETTKIDIENVPISIRPGIEMQRIQAELRIPELRQELTLATVPSRLAGVFVSGNSLKIHEVGFFLRENGGIVLNASELWNDITLAIEPSFGHERVFTTGVHFLMTQEIAHQSRRLGTVFPTLPSYVEAFCPTSQDTLHHVRGRVNSVLGDDLLIRSLKSDIVEAVIEQRLFDGRIPVLIVGAIEGDKPAISTLFTKTESVEFDSDFKVTKETITKAFKGKLTKTHGNNTKEDTDE